MRFSLERMGYRVQAVDSGQAALLAAAHDAFDAIVLDVEMPGMDGLAVAHALRCAPRTTSALIAMHTSLDETLVRARFSQYDAFVPKSGSPLVLGERVDALLRQRCPSQKTRQQGLVAATGRLLTITTWSFARFRDS
jgi:DNA-binding response OmpR family regulator